MTTPPPEVGTGYEQTDALVVAPARRRVEAIDEGDVGCSGRSKSTNKNEDRGGPPGSGVETSTGAPAPRRVGVVEEGDVGCSGKSKKKGRQKRSQTEQAEQTHLQPQSTRDMEVDINYPTQSPDRSELGSCPPPPCCYRKQIGNMYVCCEKTDREGRPGIRCAWPACWAMQIFTQSLVWGIAGLVFWFSFPEHHPWVWVVGGLLLFLTSYSLFRVGTSDPGILPIYRSASGEPPLSYPDKAQWTQYGKVGPDAFVLVPERMRTTWCSESLILVHGYDHFCPWTGTTIAGGNLKCFQTFLSSLCSLCVFVGICGITAMGMAQESNAAG